MKQPWEAILVFTVVMLIMGAYNPRMIWVALLFASITSVLTLTVNARRARRTQQ